MLPLLLAAAVLLDSLVDLGCPLDAARHLDDAVAVADAHELHTLGVATGRPQLVDAAAGDLAGLLDAQHLVAVDRRRETPSAAAGDSS